jgi:phospholipase/carboxylesterase
MLPISSTADLFRPTEGFYASTVETPRPLPVVTFLPTGYEPKYSYPLLVFFHGRGGNERQLVRLAPRVSRRNYICIGVRGPQVIVDRASGKRGFGWPDDLNSETLIEDYVFTAIEQTFQNYNVHADRIYLAGYCEGASHALRMGLRFPETFAGVVSLNGQMPHGGPLLRLPVSRQLRVLLCHGIANATVPLTTARRDFRLLYTAGLQVRLQTYPTTNLIHQDMLKDIDRWIMTSISHHHPAISF